MINIKHLAPYLRKLEMIIESVYGKISYVVKYLNCKQQYNITCVIRQGA